MLPRSMRLAFVIWALVWTFYACTDPKNPVPCTGNEKWPDPCTGAKLDGGIG